MTNRNGKTHYDPCKQLVDISDEQTRRVIAEFIDKQDYYVNRGQFLRYFCKIYPKVGIKYFTVEHLLAFLEYWKQRKWRSNPFSPIKCMLLFVFYAMEQNYVTDTSIRRLTDFKDDIDSLTGNINLIMYILRDEEYELFKASPLFTERYTSAKYLGTTLSVYSYELDKSIVLDAGIKPIVEAYIKEIKFSEDYSLATKHQRFQVISNVCKALFLDGTELCTKSLLEYLKGLKDLSFGQRVKCYKVLWDIIERINDAGIILDNNIRELINKNYNTKTMPLEKMITILESEHPEYWMAGTFAKGGDFLYFINHSVADIRILLFEFVKEYGYKSSKRLRRFCSEFETSLGTTEINKVEDFSFASLVQQVKYFYTEEKTKENENSYLMNFYYFIQERVYPFLEKDRIPIAVLNRQTLANELVEGYEIINYNQIEPAPVADKWILLFKKYDRDTYIINNKRDFTVVESCVYRRWLKEYVWKGEGLIASRLHSIDVLPSLLNYLFEIKRGKTLSIFTTPGEETEISVNDIAAVMNDIYSSSYSQHTKCQQVYDMRSLLHFVEKEHLGKIENGVFYQLTYTTVTTNNAHPIPKDEIAKLALIIKQNAEKGILGKLYQAMFFIALETEFRGSQIVDLNKNCLRETSKRNEYVLVSETKTSSGELVEQPVSSYVEREIRNIISLTELYRERCTDPAVANKLFIKPGIRRSSYNKFSASVFNAYLKSCCEKADIPRYTLENLRDTHMTMSEEYKIRRQLSDVEQRVLTGHANTITDDKNYVKFDIRDMLESLHGVIIGDVKLDGTIFQNVDSSIANEENEVENGCGWCNSPVCRIETNLGCLLCSDFVTTISRLPYFEEQLRVINQKIERATIPHDKEDLINIKRLYLKYVEEILKNKEKAENGSK